ncbi:MAG: DUF2167 domain-containing protein [Pseudomonadales bacterium]|nr:DUF2167 domain-containing protein [Pseudomonadales bacterium]
MKLKLIFILVLNLIAGYCIASDSDIVDAEELLYIEQANQLLASLDPQTGVIKLPDAVAALDVPEAFYFLDAADAEKVLVDVWGNPPDQNVLGMIFPAGLTPYDQDSWAVTIKYEEEGYVVDDDAADINYADLLQQMQEETRLASEQRQAQGYEAIELVGWAADPYYDAEANKLHWAKEIKFSAQEQNTLNYNIRVLGRKGVLVLNFIANMDQKPTIETNLEAVLAIADFEQGSTYADFDPDLDKVAAYGLGALIAGKVIAKTGFFVLALVFLKKFGIFIVLAIIAFARTLFSRRKKQASSG